MHDQDIVNVFLGGFELSWPLISNETRYFYQWATGTTFNETGTSRYWREAFGLNGNVSGELALAFNESLLAGTDELKVIADSINRAFINYVLIDFNYTRYYEQCAPFQCVYYTEETKDVIDVCTVVLGLIGGVHAALFIVINLFHSVVEQCRRKEEEVDEKEDVEAGMEAEMTAAINTKE